MWDERYSEPGFAYGSTPNDFLVEQGFRLIDPVLEIGCGQGRNLVWAAKHGHKVTGMDGSSVGLDDAQDFADEEGVRIKTVVADLNGYNLGKRRWGTIISIFVHLPPRLRREVHAGIVEALKPGGVVILESYGPAQLGRGTGGPNRPELLPGLEDLCMDFAGLDLVHAVEIERDVSEGTYHSAMAAVVQIVGVKPG